jgi:hypothetical protein
MVLRITVMRSHHEKASREPKKVYLSLPLFFIHEILGGFKVEGRKTLEL